ncbi:MAG: glycosyltransferase family 4 protein [Nitrospiraceae bacterium]
MRVLQVHNHYRSTAPSGEDAVVDGEAELLRRRGVEVVAYRVFNDDIDTATLGARARLAWQTVWSIRSKNQLREEIRRCNPDLVHVHNTFPQISPSVFAACTDESVPCVQTLHNFRHICASALLSRGGNDCELCVGHLPVPAVRYRCYRNSLGPTLALVGMQVFNRVRGTYFRDVAQYICLTKFAALKFEQAGFPVNKLRVKPNFLAEMPQRIHPPSTYALYVGRLSKEKGVGTLIRAWQDCNSVHLKVLGDGPEREQLEAIATHSRLNVEFRGYVPRAEVAKEISRAMFVIVPSECYEGFPMTVVEAFAHGVPVIASETGSLAEIVEVGVTGLTFPARDSGALARVVHRLHGDSELRDTLSKGAREKAQRCFSADANFQILMSIYEDARKLGGQGDAVR